MNDRDTEFAQPAEVVTESPAFPPWRRYLRLALEAVVVVACCEVLTIVWHETGDESHRQTMAAVRALDCARTSGLRIEAIQDLIRPTVIDGRVTIPHLIRSLADPAPDVRVEAVRSLGPAASAAAMVGSGDELVTAAIAALRTALDDPEPAVRIASVHTLGAIAASRNPSGVIQPQAVVAALAAMLDDCDPTVRASTIAALGLAGPVAAPEPPPALIAALNDESSFNRAAARHALARFSTPVHD